MRILVLGAPYSRWVKEYVEQVLLPLGHDVTVYYGQGDDDSFYTYYKQAGVTCLCPRPVHPLMMKIPKVRGLFILRSKLKALQSQTVYDVIINLFVNNWNLWFSRRIAGEHTKIVAYFLGSDILRCEGKKLERLKKRLRVVSRVRFSSEKIKNGYQKKISHAVLPDEDVIHLGASVFKAIDELDMDHSEAKKALHLSPDRICLCIGYNAGKAQQHLEVLHQLERLSAERKAGIELLFPMTYAKDPAYMSRVRSAAEKTGMSFRILEDFMDDRQMAVMCRAIDVLIHAQTTDAFSSTLRECMYAGGYVLNAKWLDYPEYHRWQLDYNSFDEFDDLPDAIEAVCAKLPVFSAKKNRDILSGADSWEATKTAWDELLREIG